MSHRDPRAETAAAVLNAVLDVARGRDGAGLVTIDLEDARWALLVALATVLEVDPRVRAPSDIRREADRVARDVRLLVRAQREHIEAGGTRAWNATQVSVN